MLTNILATFVLLFLSIYIAIAVSSWMLANNIRELHVVKNRCFYVPYFYFRILFKGIIEQRNIKKLLKFTLNVQQAILFILYSLQEEYKKKGTVIS